MRGQRSPFPILLHSNQQIAHSSATRIGRLHSAHAFRCKRFTVSSIENCHFTAFSVSLLPNLSRRTEMCAWRQNHFRSPAITPQKKMKNAYWTRSSQQNRAYLGTERNNTYPVDTMIKRLCYGERVIQARVPLHIERFSIQTTTQNTNCTCEDIKRTSTEI